MVVGRRRNPATTPRYAAVGRERGSEGYALLLTLFVAVFVELAALLAFAVFTEQLHQTQQTSREVRLTALCDAAIAETLARLENDPGFTGIQRHPFGRTFDSGSELGWIASEVSTVAERSFIEASAGIGPLERRAQVVADRIHGRLQVTGFR